LVNRKADANYLNTKSNFNLGPLFHAITSRKPEVVEFLLNNGANANVTNEWGLTPFICAKLFPNEESDDKILNLLVKHGAIDDNLESLDKE